MKDFWIVLPRGIAAKWTVEQLTPAQAFQRGKSVLAMAGPYSDASESAAAQFQAETARVMAFARHRSRPNFMHGRGTR